MAQQQAQQQAQQPPPQSIVLNPLKYLGNLPEFFGDSRDLQNFTSLIDRVHPELQNYDALSQEVFSDIIKSRLKGRAREIIEINCQAVSWTEIKQILQNNFGDRLSTEDLFDELRSTVFRTNSVEFYNEIKNKLRRLNNKTIIILGPGEAANTCARNNMRTALNVFKAKISDPMKTILACRNPPTLEAAMNILFESGYAYLDTDKPKRNQTQSQNNHPQQRNINNRQNNLNSQHNRSNQYNSNSYNQRQQQNRQETYAQYNRPRQNNYSNPDRHNQYSNSYSQRQTANRQETYTQYNRPRQDNYPVQQNFNQQNNTWRRQDNTSPPIRQPVPEPMDINNHEISENFLSIASSENYPI